MKKGIIREVLLWTLSTLLCGVAAIALLWEPETIGLVIFKIMLTTVSFLAAVAVHVQTKQGRRIMEQ